MEQAIQMVATASLSHWGLTLHYGTTEPGTVLQVLAERYGFWEDDMPHADRDLREGKRARRPAVDPRSSNGIYIPSQSRTTHSREHAGPAQFACCDQ
jgi:hypothetical protein